MNIICLCLFEEQKKIDSRVQGMKRTSKFNHLNIEILILKCFQKNSELHAPILIPNTQYAAQGFPNFFLLNFNETDRFFN